MQTVLGSSTRVSPAVGIPTGATGATGATDADGEAATVAAGGALVPSLAGASRHAASPTMAIEAKLDQRMRLITISIG
jgi:hypothetical protein